MSDAPARRRLPNRRPAVTEPIQIGEYSYEATIGFNQDLRPKEIFLAGAKEGSQMAALLMSAGAAISVALQHGVTAEAMARSVSREPDQIDGPATKPADAIAAALDLIARYEREAAR